MNESALPLACLPSTQPPRWLDPFAVVVAAPCDIAAVATGCPQEQGIYAKTEEEGQTGEAGRSCESGVEKVDTIKIRGRCVSGMNDQ